MLNGHTDWVRDVAWAPNIGMPGNYIASCSQVRRQPLISMGRSTNDRSIGQISFAMEPIAERRAVAIETAEKGKVYRNRLASELVAVRHLAGGEQR